MEEENTQPGTKSQTEVEIEILRQMPLGIEETGAYHQNPKDHLGHLMNETLREEDHMTVDMIHMKDQVMTDLTTVVEEEVATGRMIDHNVREDTTEGVEEDTHHVEIGAVTIEDEEDTTEGILEAMIEVEEEGMIEVAIEVIQEGI